MLCSANAALEFPLSECRADQQYADDPANSPLIMAFGTMQVLRSLVVRHAAETE